ncbi:MAG: hypothetical protein IT186_05860 [Acidobacteria bacterium]|nr:hypothetical protein [Acidobacteriota bacterium]
MSVDPIASRRFAEGLSTHLEDYLAAWKSSIADARREIDQILTGIGEKIPAQAKPLFPEDIVSLLLEDVRPPPTPPQKIIEKVVEKVVERVEVPVPTGGADWSLIRGALCTIESARTQVDILSRFLSEANSHASRVALLVLRNDRLTGWKGVGFDGSGGRDDAIKAVDLGTNDDPFVAEVLKRERTMFASPPPEGPLRRALGGKAPAKTVLIPMVIRDRLAGLLVADELPGEDGRVNEAALEILTFVTGLTVDLLAARKKIPSPTLTPTGEAILRFGPPPAAPAPAMTPAMPFDIPAAKPAPLSTATDPAFMTVAAPSIKLPPPEPKKTVAAPPSPPVDTKRKMTDTSEALRALEESAAGRKRSEISDFEVPKFVRPDPAPPVEAPKPRVVSAPPPVSAPAPAPAPAAPIIPPLQGGEVTLAFESLRGSPGHPPAAPMRPPAPPTPAVAAPPAPAPAPPAVRPPVAPPEPPRPAVVAPPAAAAAPSALPAADALGGAGVAPMAPPAGFVPRSRLGGRQDDPRRAAEDARRLARLLISEIKLYNEKKVQEGKASGDIYERLKDDIERSRQVFNERVPEAVRREADYFHEELVRILADGKPDALGPIN